MTVSQWNAFLSVSNLQLVTSYVYVSGLGPNNDVVSNHRQALFVPEIVLLMQGVRYTAVEGEVDLERISAILEGYFGARTS